MELRFVKRGGRHDGLTVIPGSAASEIFRCPKQASSAIRRRLDALAEQWNGLPTTAVLTLTFRRATVARRGKLLEDRSAAPGDQIGCLTVVTPDLISSPACFQSKRGCG